jgi:hypothetical protein
MGQIGFLLVILGFGTFILNAFDYEFTVLSWADDYQPWLSLGLGVLGLVILGIRFFAGRGKEAPANATKDA